MRRATRWWLGAVLAVVAVGPAAWAEREKKPANPPAKAPDHGIKPPPGKPTADARPESGAMVKIAGGRFRMGDEGGGYGQSPTHEVTVKTFWLDVTEVTVAAYKACVDGGGCSTDQLTALDRCNWGKADRGNHPINCVDWSQATAFCRWANKRLPTEEEWEFAARPGGSKYPWGEAEPGAHLCWNGDGNDLGKGKRQGTCAVGSFAAGNTKTGLKDMSGNVAEWTATEWCTYATWGYDLSDCSAHRVFRNGYWADTYADMAQGSARRGGTPDKRQDYLGLRCARSD